MRMMMMSFCRTAALCLLLLTGCMTTPQNGDTQSNTTQLRRFDGFYPGGGVTITLEAATSASGPYVAFATATTSATGYTVNGIAMHPWSVHTAVPTWNTTTCGNQETFVRARQLGGLMVNINLVHFDAAKLREDGASGVSCLINMLSAGETVADATFACDSDTGAARILAGDATRERDLAVHTQAQADAADCYTHIDGSLSITDDSGELDIALPYLKQLTGDLNVVYSRDASAGWDPEIRNVRLPSLTSVGGDIDLSYPGNPSDIAYVTLGLEALTSAAGNVTVHSDAFNTDFFGMDGLTRIVGDLSVTQNGSDFTLYGLLPNLTAVFGDVELSSSNTIVGVFNNLTLVGGNVTLSGVYLADWGQNFTSLLSIGGELSMANLSLPTVVNQSFRHFPALGSVGAALRCEQLSEFTELLIGDPTGITVGSLELKDNSALNDLSATHLSVAGSGDVVITNNSSLPTADVNKFVAAQAAGGWTGSATVSGNAP